MVLRLHPVMIPHAFHADSAHQGRTVGKGYSHGSLGHGTIGHTPPPCPMTPCLIQFQGTVLIDAAPLTCSLLRLSALSLGACVASNTCVLLSNRRRRRTLDSM